MKQNNVTRSELENNELPYPNNNKVYIENVDN